MKGYTRPALPEDIQVVAADMRPADVAEIKAANNATPEEALQLGLLSQLHGARVRTICLPDGTPVGMYGVVPSHLPEAGIMWMLAATRIKEIQTTFLRECRKEIAEITQGYRLVFNYTDARNRVHHRWLKWCGFSIINKHEQWGYEQRPFYEFCKITEVTHV